MEELKSDDFFTKSKPIFRSGLIVYATILIAFAFAGFFVSYPLNSEWTNIDIAGNLLMVRIPLSDAIKLNSTDSFTILTSDKKEVRVSATVKSVEFNVNNNFCNIIAEIKDTSTNHFLQYIGNSAKILFKKQSLFTILFLKKIKQIPKSKS